MAVRILLAVAAFMLLAPVAIAQGAPPPNVTVEPSVDTLVVSREGDGTLSVTVRYTSDNPFDDEAGGMTRQVELVASQTPAGWAVTIDPPVARASDGQALTFNVRVTLGSSATQTEVPVTFTAKVGRAGLPTTPLTDSVDPEGTAEAQVVLKRQDPLTREVLENVGGWIWAVLGGLAVLAVVLAVVLARSNRPVVALSCAVKQARLSPGRSVAIPVVVENLTGVEDNVIFHVAPVRQGWAAALPVPELPLDGRRREELHLVVTAPKDARPGDSVQVGLTAHGAQNPKRPAEVVVEVVVEDTEARRAAGDTTPADVQKAQAARK